MNKKKLVIRICAIISGLSGVVILSWIFAPIIFYRLNVKVTKGGYLSAVPQTNTNYLDDTKASNWFVGGKTSDEFGRSSVAYYNLSIPTLNIVNATVSIGGEDLNQSLIQYPGTALPGQSGSTTIFGHSVLPAFYNPKRYETIFSKLPELTAGDAIEVHYDGVTYKYRVESKQVVNASDIAILDQDLSDSFLNLVTCVPPGDPSMPYREVVKARIVPL